LIFLKDKGGFLVNTIVPNLAKQSNLESQGLLIDGGKDKSLFISSSWSAAEVMSWLRDNHPKPFDWLEANLSSRHARCRLLIKVRHRFSLCMTTAPTCYDFNKYKGGMGKHGAEGKSGLVCTSIPLVFLQITNCWWTVSSIEIPYDVYTNWQLISPKESEAGSSDEQNLAALSEYEGKGLRIDYLTSAILLTKLQQDTTIENLCCDQKREGQGQTPTTPDRE
jgi:hypothetical protein